MPAVTLKFMVLPSALILVIAASMVERSNPSWQANTISSSQATGE